MDSSTHALILFTIFLSFFFHSLSPTTTASAATVNTTTPSKLVVKACSHDHQYNKFCINALGSDPRTKTAPNLLDLTKIALQMAISNATNTRGHIHDAINKKGTQLAKRAILERCLDSYDYVVESFKSALEEVQEKEYETATYDSKVAADGAKSCEDSLASGQVRDLSISTGNEYVEKFSSVGFTLTDLLEQGSPP